MLTEEEAKAKWCPFARFAVDDDDENAANRWNDENGNMEENPAPCRCIASQCMAWRWQRVPEEVCFTNPGEPPPGPDWRAYPGDQGEIVHWDKNKLRWRRVSVPTGFCGMAGRPE